MTTHTGAPDSQPSIVIIDDDDDLLQKLAAGLRETLAEDRVDVRTWLPSAQEDPRAEFDNRVDATTTLVITDYDLTKNGLIGLFGVSIVSWCQARLIPVGDFSRGHLSNLPREPNLFELRIPTDLNQAIQVGSTAFRGFRDLRAELARDADQRAQLRSPAEALAAAVGRPHLEAQFALYMSRLSASNSALLDRLRTAMTPGTPEPDKAQLLAYVIGHVLCNAVLRYPGPLLSQAALVAFCSTATIEAPMLSKIFADALYTGPFSSDGPYFWRQDVDRIMDVHASAMPDRTFETGGQYNRAVIEHLAQRPLASHSCARCGGLNGGYYCPLTDRPVCERADCSIAANSWIPAGADLCRIERDFYDEWSPLLGL